MVETSQAVGLALTLLSSLLFGYVGRRLQRRPVPAEDALAWRLFVVWWYGLAFTTLVGAANTALAFAGLASLPLFLVMTTLTLVVLCVALWGLLYYLIYVFTGSKRSLPWLTVFYVAYLGLLVYYIYGSGPSGVRLTHWNAQLEYSHQITGPVFAVVLALLVLPQILGAMAYATLYFRTPERTQRYRIALVSTSIIVWFGSALYGSVAGLAETTYWQLASRLIGLAASAAVLMAYVPPRFIRTRFGIEPMPIQEPGASTPTTRTVPAHAERRRLGPAPY